MATELKLVISDLALRLSKMGRLLGEQMKGKRVAQRDKYFLGLLRRQFVLLEDAAMVLKNRPAMEQASTFILFRCLLDDFIIMFYLETKQFDEDCIIGLLAQSHKKELEMYEHSLRMNVKYHQGKNEDLTTQEWYDEQRAAFYNDPGNDVFFASVNERKWKTAPSIRSMVDQFPVDEYCAAHSHAFVLWSLMSKYVHYTDTAYRLDLTPASREIEIRQLIEVLFFVYKTVHTISVRLNASGFDVELRDETDLIGEIYRHNSIMANG